MDADLGFNNSKCNKEKGEKRDDQMVKTSRLKNQKSPLPRPILVACAILFAAKVEGGIWYSALEQNYHISYNGISIYKSSTMQPYALETQPLKTVQPATSLYTRDLLVSESANQIINMRDQQLCKWWVIETGGRTLKKYLVRSWTQSESPI